MIRSREERLMPAFQLAQDLSACREMLLSYGSTYSLIIKWLDASINLVTSQLHPGVWPPIWWRYGGIDGEARWLAHLIHRVDAEGYFYAETESGYVPERDEIISMIDSIAKSYRARRR